MIDRKKFYDTLRGSLFKHGLKQHQVAGFEAILNAWEKDPAHTDHRHLAYMMATAWHETAFTMQPVEEYGKGKGKPYGLPHPTTGQAYYGRGHVQLTWHENYQRFGRLLNINLVTTPALALDMDTSVRIMMLGMTRGLFTGKKLADYITPAKCDYTNARRIINGIDKAVAIAAYAEAFERGLV